MADRNQLRQHARVTVAPLKLLALLALGLPASWLCADVYKWIDGEGETNYSDRHPSGREAQVLRAGEQAVAESPEPTAGEPASAAAFRERRVKADALDKKQQQAALDGKRRTGECAQERERVRLLMQPRRLAQHDDKGEPVVLDDDARQRELARSEKFIAQNCTPP